MTRGPTPPPADRDSHDAFVNELRRAYRRGQLVVLRTGRRQPARARVIDAAAVAELMLATPGLFADAGPNFIPLQPTR
jgi:hypothetical protein